MEIYSSRVKLTQKLKDNTFQNAFPDVETCECGHRMLPVFSLIDEEGIFVRHRPKLNDGEFWFHDAVAVATYLCVDPNCGQMKALWNQA